MKVIFIYSQQAEIKKLMEIYKYYQFFLDNDFPILLPVFFKKLYQQTKTKKEFQAGLITQFKHIYNAQVYKSKKTQIQKNWQVIEKEFFTIIKSLMPGLKIRDKYQCVLSLYGPQGMYYYPNEFNLRASTKSDFAQINMTIAHELVHLFFYHKLEKLSQEQKEGAVDLIMTNTDLNQLFPKYYWQNYAQHDLKIFKQILI